jgi:hypothetical protein
MSAPEWAYLKFPQIDLQDIYYSAQNAKKIKDLSEVDRTTKNI